MWGVDRELLALGALALGVGLAFAARFVVSRVADAERFGDGTLSRAVRLLAPALFWTILAAGAAAALALSGVGEVSGLLDGVFSFLPRLLVGAATLGVGHLVGALLRDLAKRRAPTLILSPGGIYWLVFATAVIAAAQQLGVEVSFLTQLALVAFTVTFGALGIAFALGARRHVANLIAYGELAAYQEGDRLRLDGIEGTVVEKRRAALVLATEEGFVTIPAARFAETAVTRLTAPEK